MCNHVTPIASLESYFTWNRATIIDDWKEGLTSAQVE